ncbi:Uncharacterized protein FWK35_00006579 [Aphis craccivora]|uniref:Uncharacterized protein n=1 Tax=Aphis craccivora TaxID=307492 RepID=A0A6G0ZNP1_APHCR|nr:Uncharacterized protein FWK35_00006579 [Aphis craccivora]
MAVPTVLPTRQLLHIIIPRGRGLYRSLVAGRKKPLVRVYISFWETRPLVFAVPSLHGRSTAINQTGKSTTIKLRTQPSPPLQLLESVRRHVDIKRDSSSSVSIEEVEFLEFIAEVSRAAAVLPIPAIYSEYDVDEPSNTLSSDGVHVNFHPTESVCSKSESEARVKAKLITPILRHIENVTEPNSADIRTSLKFSMMVLFLWRVEDKSSTSLFSGEITESHLPRIPLCLGNPIELANALRASAFLNALKLPITVIFLRRNTDIVSTYFFGGSSSVQIRCLGCESSILGEVNTTHRNNHGTDSGVPEIRCRQLMASDNTAEIEGDGTETMAEIKPAEKPVEWTSIQRKPILNRLGRRLLKIGRRLCCYYFSKLD